MNSTATAEDGEAQHDGFTVESTVPLSIWTDYTFDRFGEYIHLIPDVENRELRIYRSINDDGEDNRRLRTVINGVSFTYHFEDSSSEINSFYLTGMEAQSFLTFIDFFEANREGTLRFTWWEESGTKMMENERTGIETLNLNFTKPNGVERHQQITSAWQTPTHKMANIAGEGFNS